MPVPGLEEVRKWEEEYRLWKEEREAFCAKTRVWDNLDGWLCDPPRPEDLTHKRPEKSWIEMQKLYPAAFAYLKAEKIAHCGNEDYEAFGREAMEAIENGADPEEAIARMQRQQVDLLFDKKILFGEEK